MIPMLLSYIDENITMSSEAVLMKKSPCKWKRDWWKSSHQLKRDWWS